MTVREKKVCTYRGGKGRGRRPGRGGVIFDWRTNAKKMWRTKQPTWEEVTASRKKVKNFPETMNNCPTLGEKKMTAHICHLLPRRQKARFRGAKGRIAPPLDNSLLRGIFSLVSSEDTFVLRRSSENRFRNSFPPRCDTRPLLSAYTAQWRLTRKIG